MRKVKLKEDGTRVYDISESSSRKGDFAEYYAITWLWDNGYEVFPNAGCNGPVDIIALKDGEVTLIDVKTNRAKANRNKEQKELGVVFVAFEPETRKLRWVDHRE